MNEKKTPTLRHFLLPVISNNNIRSSPFETTEKEILTLSTNIKSTIMIDYCGKTFQLSKLQIK